MELTLVGLQNSGKTTLVNVVAVRAHIARTQPAAPPPLAGHRSRVAMVRRRAAFPRT